MAATLFYCHPEASEGSGCFTLHPQRLTPFQPPHHCHPEASEGPCIVTYALNDLPRPVIVHRRDIIIIPYNSFQKIQISQIRVRL